MVIVVKRGYIVEPSDDYFEHGHDVISDIKIFSDTSTAEEWCVKNRGWEILALNSRH